MKNIVCTFAAVLFMALVASKAKADPPPGFGSCVGYYNGVTAYSNGSTSYVSPLRNYVNGYKTGIKWQCAEFCVRYYYQVNCMQIHGLGDAKNWFANANSVGLKSYSNGLSVAPRVGDILCTNSGPGHVAIIREVGSNYVKVIQQNWFEDCRDNAMSLSMTVVNGNYKIQPAGSYVWQGWLRR